MTDPDYNRLQDLLRLAELAQSQSAANLQQKSAHETRLALQMATLSPRRVLEDGSYDLFTATGQAAHWQTWLHLERRRLSILSARARLAVEAARRSHAKTTARYQVLEKLTQARKPKRRD